MPQDLSCPKCTHVFPVTEARHPVGVKCPGCDAELTAEFRKPAGPVDPGKPPYDLHVKLGKPKPPGGVATEEPDKKKRHDDEEEGKSKGGSMMIVMVAGLGAMLVALGGLGTTGYFLFTNLDTSDATIYNLPKAGQPGGNQAGNKGDNKGGNQGGNKGGNPDSGQKEQPKKIDTFELRPVVGAPTSIAPPPNDLSSPQTILLPGKAGAIAVGGGGRYLVMHFPEQGRLSVFDVNAGDFTANESTPNGEVQLAAGATKVVVSVPGSKKLQVYSLPELKPENNFEQPFFHGLKTMTMGSKTNGPLLVLDPFGEGALMDLATGKVIEATTVKGVPQEHIRAMPDGKLFIAAKGVSSNDKVSMLDESGRKWRVREPELTAAYPGPDSRHLFGFGQIITTDGKPVAGKGPSIGNVWYVPAVTQTGNYFLKLTEIKGTGPGKKSGLSIAIHKGYNNVDKPVLPPLQDLPATLDLIDFRANRSQPLDRHFFLIFEAKLLAILNLDKTTLTLQKVNLK